MLTEGIMLGGPKEGHFYANRLKKRTQSSVQDLLAGAKNCSQDKSHREREWLSDCFQHMKSFANLNFFPGEKLFFLLSVVVIL